MTRYMLKPSFVDAEQVQASTVIHTTAGDCVAYPGEWVINGKVIMKDAAFKAIYDLVPASTSSLEKEPLVAHLVKETTVTLTQEEVNEVVLPKQTRRQKD